jgi:hypothetical protein
LFLLSQPGDATEEWVWPSQEDQKIIFDTYFGLKQMPDSNDLGPFTISGLTQSIKKELVAAVQTWNLPLNRMYTNEFIDALEASRPRSAHELIETYIDLDEDYHFEIKSSTRELIMKEVSKERLEEAQTYLALIRLYKATKKEAKEATEKEAARSQSSLPRAVGRSVEDAAIISYLLFWVQRKCKTNDCMRWLIRVVIGAFDGTYVPGSSRDVHAGLKVWAWRGNIIFKSKFFARLKMKSKMTAAELILAFEKMPNYHEWIISNSKKQVVALLKNKSSLAVADPLWLPESSRKPWTKSDILEHVNALNEYGDLWDFIDRQQFPSQTKTWNQNTTQSRTRLLSDTNRTKRTKKTDMTMPLYAYLLWSLDKNQSLQTIFDAFRGQTMRLNSGLQEELSAGLKVWTWGSNLIIYNELLDLFENSANNANNVIAKFKKVQSYHTDILENTKTQIKSLVWKELEPDAAKQKLAKLDGLSKYNQLWKFILTQTKTKKTDTTMPLPPDYYLSAFNRSISHPRSVLKASVSNSPTRSTKATVTMSEPVIYAYLLWSLDKNQSLQTIFDAFRGQTMRLNSGLQEELSAGLKVWTWGSNVIIYNELLDLFENSDNFDANNVIAKFKKVQSYHTDILENTKTRIKRLVWNELESDAAKQKLAKLDGLSEYNQLWKFIQTQNTQLPGWEGEHTNNVSLQTKESSKGMGTGRALWGQRTRVSALASNGGQYWWAKERV